MQGTEGFLVLIFLQLLKAKSVGGHEEAKLLYETLMTGYNKLIRPVTFFGQSWSTISMNWNPRFGTRAKWK